MHLNQNSNPYWQLVIMFAQLIILKCVYAWKKFTLGPIGPFKPGAPGNPTSPYSRQMNSFDDISDSD